MKIQPPESSSDRSFGNQFLACTESAPCGGVDGSHSALTVHLRGKTIDFVYH